MTTARPVPIGCLLVAALATSLPAQEITGRASGAVRGLVYDSVAARPLAGASVEMAVRDGASAPRIAVTDATGRYRFDSVPTGRYVLGFFHDALTALGLDAVTRNIDLAVDTTATVDLSIPSSAMVRFLRCGRSEEFAQGMLVGSVRDAQSGAAIAGAKATVHWRAFALDSANYRVVEDQSPATITSEGALLACNLPLDAPLDLLVTAPGHRAVDGTVVAIPPNGIGRLDVMLADSSLATGTAVIRGRVMRMSGKAVESGRVVIKALGRDVAVKNGEFVAANLPTGSWVAESRVIGVEPQDVLVTATESSVATANITVSNGPQRLDAVTVIGKPSQDLRVLDDVLRRSRVGMGTTFLPGHPALRSARLTSDVMKEARGFQWSGPENITGRSRCRDVAVYVNDVRQPDGFIGADDVAPVSEVLAVETWADMMWAPIQYRRSGLGNTRVVRGSSRTCGVVLIWTRRHF
jgi:hypothetical protein